MKQCFGFYALMLLHFQHTPDCNAFTHLQDTEVCFVWDYCTEFSPDTCTDCISGEVTCDATVSSITMSIILQSNDIRFPVALWSPWPLPRSRGWLFNRGRWRRMSQFLQRNWGVLMVFLRFQWRPLFADIFMRCGWRMQQWQLRSWANRMSRNIR